MFALTTFPGFAGLIAWGSWHEGGSVAEICVGDDVTVDK